MVDLYLQALMHGEILKKNMSNFVSSREKKNRFELETEKAIEAYVSTLTFEEEDSSHSKLTTPEIERGRIRAELREQAKLPELSSFIEAAFKILSSEGENYLGSDNFELMNEDFASGNETLQKIDLKSRATENFQTLLNFTDSTIDSIFKVAVEKFNELQFSDSLALFILLTTLNSENPDYWHRAGILAQKCENYELAIRLYSAATSLDPLLIGPWIFSIDCYLKREMHDEAQSAYVEAKKINESFQVDDSWKEALTLYEFLLIKP